MDLWYSLCKNNKATYKEGPAIQKKNYVHKEEDH